MAKEKTPNAQEILDGIKAFMKEQEDAISNAIDAAVEKRKQLTAELDQQIEELCDAYTKATEGKVHPFDERKASGKATKGTRTKRSKEERQAEAAKLVKAIKEAGAKGIPAKELKQVADYGPNLAKFLNDNANGQKVKKIGDKVNTRWAIA